MYVLLNQWIFLGATTCKSMCGPNTTIASPQLSRRSTSSTAAARESAKHHVQAGPPAQCYNPITTKKRWASIILWTWTQEHGLQPLVPSRST